MKFVKIIVLSLLSSIGLYAQDSNVPKTEDLDSAVEESMVPPQPGQAAPKKAAKKKVKKNVKVKKIKKAKKGKKVKKMKKKPVKIDDVTENNNMGN